MLACLRVNARVRSREKNNNNANCVIYTLQYNYFDNILALKFQNMMLETFVLITVIVNGFKELF